MDFSIPEEIRALCDEITSFVEKEIYPLERELKSFKLEEGGAPYPPEIVKMQKKCRDLGWWCFHMPKEAGGPGLSVTHYGLVNEILGRSWLAPLCVNSMAPDSGNMEILWLHGTKEQKERWLKPLMNAEIRSCFSMTEPAVAGSDPKLLQGTAVKDGDEYVINGHKWFTSGAHGAAFAIVMAKTNPAAPSPYLQFSQIIVPMDAPGLKILRGIPVMGSNHNHHAEIEYTDVRVPVTNRLGGEGMGFVIAQDRLGPGRIHHCMRWMGVAQRCFDLMCDYAVQRETFGSTLSRKQNIQDWVADSRAEILAARMMTLYAAWKIDTQGPKAAREEISLIKFFGAKVMHNVIDRAIQVHGAMGVTDDLPLSFFYREARMARLYDGPDEVHRMVVARRILEKFANKGR